VIENGFPGIELDEDGELELEELDELELLGGGCGGRELGDLLPELDEDGELELEELDELELLELEELLLELEELELSDSPSCSIPCV
jgi:hypothetical protein